MMGWFIEAQAQERGYNNLDVTVDVTVQEHEPGWLGGELNGKIGWFPEAYAQKLGEGGEPQERYIKAKYQSD